MPFRMPPMPFPMPLLFITAVKDICAINTFEKLLNILFSEVYYITIVFRNYNWYVSIWGIKFVSPLTTRTSVFSSSPTRRPWCSNSQNGHGRFIFHWADFIARERLHQSWVYFHISSARNYVFEWLVHRRSCGHSF